MPYILYRNNMVSLVKKAKNTATGPGKNRQTGNHTRALNLVLALSLLFIPIATAKSLILEKDLRVVVIDPGHGGNDNGAQGPNGTFEKDVTLNLARMIAQKLEPEFRTVLTRNDDYGLDNTGRTAVANHAKADILISLHTASSFGQGPAGSAVYFFQPFQESALATESQTPEPLTESDPAVSWDMIQAKHRVASEKLARLIQSGLNKLRHTPHAKIQGAPLLVLEGADMPAVAIEIGNLSNAGEEKLMGDSQFLSEIARVIVDGIEAFLSEKTR